MRIATVFFIVFIFILSCTNSRAINTPAMEDQDETARITDSVLRSLHENNELVIGVAFENFAWGHHASFNVFVMNNGEWNAFSWYSNYNQHGVVPNVNPSIINADTCKSVLAFLKEKNIDKVKGDEGKPGCADPGKKCNINDGGTWHLFWLTKEKTIAPSYYEPQHFEDCCPGNEDRKKFLEAVNKIVTALEVQQKGR